jgi:hypothetical protein
MKKNLGIRLTNYALAVLVISVTIAAAMCLLQKSYISGFLLFLGAGFLLLSCRWSDYGRISLLLFLIFFYLVAYGANVFLILTNKKDNAFRPPGNWVAPMTAAPRCKW